MENTGTGLGLILSPRTYNTVTNRGFVKSARGVTAAVAITYLYLVVVAIVERLENFGRGPVESVYTHLSWNTQGPVTSILS